MDLEKEILSIQKSTKTLFRVFLPIHDWLRLHIRPYYIWSLKPYARAVHWVILLAYLASLPVAFRGYFINPNDIKAAEVNFTESFSNTYYKDTNNTTARWVDGEKPRLKHVQEPARIDRLSGESHFASDYITSVDDNGIDNANIKKMTSQFVSGSSTKDGKDAVYYFGGIDTNGHENITLKYYTQTDTYEQLSASATSFPLAYLQAIYPYNKSVYDSNDNKIYWFADDKVFEFNVTTEKFSSSVTSTPSVSWYSAPDTRWVTNTVANPAVAYISDANSSFHDKIIMIGGYLYGSHPWLTGTYHSGFGTVYSFNTDTKEFTQISETLSLSTYYIDYDTLSLSEVEAKTITGGKAIYYRGADGKDYIYITGSVGFNTGIHDNTTFIYPHAISYNLTDGIFSRGADYDYSAQDPNNFPLFYTYDLYPGTLDIPDIGASKINNRVYIYGGAGYSDSSPRKWVTLNKLCYFDLPSDSDDSITCTIPAVSPQYPPLSVTEDSANYKSYLYPLDNSVIRSYNTSNSTFSSMPVSSTEGMFNTKKYDFALINDGSNLFFAGGASGGTLYTGDIYQYNFTSRQMQRLENNTVTPSFSKAIGFYAGGYYYIFGGQTGTSAYQDTVLRSSDPTSQAFSSAGTLPCKIYNGKAVEVNGLIYIFGRNQTTSQTPPNNCPTTVANRPILIKYNPANGLSSSIALNSSYFISNYKMNPVLASNGLIYIFSAWNNSSSNNIATLDPNNNDLLSLLPGVTSPLDTLTGSQVALDDKIYLFKGTDIAIFDISTNVINLSPSKLNYSRSSMSSVVHNSKAYVFGGHTASNLGTTFPNEVVSLEYDNTHNVIQSKKINPDSSLIYRATLTADATLPSGTSIQYKLSVDGGQSWQDVASGVPHTFTRHSLIGRAYAAGNDLRWKAEMTGNGGASPTINSVNISYITQPSKLYINPYYEKLIAGKPSASPLSIALKDAAGRESNALRDIDIKLSSTSPEGRFSAYSGGVCTNDWAADYHLILPQGSSSVQFCYYDTVLDKPTIKAESESSGMESSSLKFYYAISPGDIDFEKSSVTFSPEPATADNARTNINVYLKDNSGNALADHGLSIFSSRSEDNISQPGTPTDSQGYTSGEIRSKKAGSATIIVKDESLGIFLPSKNLNFIPGPIRKIDLNLSNQNVNPVYGQSVSIIATAKDYNDNLVDPYVGTMAFASSDSNAILPLPYTFQSDDKATHEFSVIFNSIGDQTITVTDEKTKVSKTLSLFVNPAAASPSASEFKTSKTKLVVGKDTATLTVKILDPDKNPHKGKTVAIDFDKQSGSLDAEQKTTDETGSATFTFTPSPSAKGKLKLVAKDISDNFTLDETQEIDLLPDTLLNNLESLVDTLQNSPLAQKIADIAKNIVTTATTLGLIPLLANIVGSAPSIIHFSTYSISLLLEAAGIRKRRRSWGRVYDSASGKGIDMALVRLFDQRTMNLKGTVVTDPKGRFSFHAQPGTYSISVTKEGYLFPTQIFAKYGIASLNKKAATINSHYLGQPINVDKGGEEINLEIPIDSVKNKGSIWLKIKIVSSDILNLFVHGFSYVTIPLLALGFLASAFTLLVIPNARNYILMIAYSVVALSFVFSKAYKRSRCGVVYDSKTKKPIEGAAVSLFDKHYDTLKETRITDNLGHFSISAQPGDYYIKVSAEGYSFPSTQIPEKTKKDKYFKNLYFRGVLHFKDIGFVINSIPGDRGIERD